MPFSIFLIFLCFVNKFYTSDSMNQRQQNLSQTVNKKSSNPENKHINSNTEPHSLHSTSQNKNNVKRIHEKSDLRDLSGGSATAKKQRTDSNRGQDNHLEEKGPNKQMNQQSQNPSETQRLSKCPTPSSINPNVHHITQGEHNPQNEFDCLNSSNDQDGKSSITDNTSFNGTDLKKVFYTQTSVDLPTSERCKPENPGNSSNSQAQYPHSGLSEKETKTITEDLPSSLSDRKTINRGLKPKPTGSVGSNPKSSILYQIITRGSNQPKFHNLRNVKAPFNEIVGSISPNSVPINCCTFNHTTIKASGFEKKRGFLNILGDKYEAANIKEIYFYQVEYQMKNDNKPESNDKISFMALGFEEDISKILATVEKTKSCPVKPNDNRLVVILSLQKIDERLKEGYPKMGCSHFICLIWHNIFCPKIISGSKNINHNRLYKEYEFTHRLVFIDPAKISSIENINKVQNNFMIDVDSFTVKLSCDPKIIYDVIVDILIKILKKPENLPEYEKNLILKKYFDIVDIYEKNKMNRVFYITSKILFLLTFPDFNDPNKINFNSYRLEFECVEIDTGRN